MDKVKWRVAVASTDGITVNMHFGQADKFFIFDKDGDKFRITEKREFPAACAGGIHDSDRILTNLYNLSDCEYLLTMRIGPGVANLAESLGLSVYELPGNILDGIDEIERYEQVKDLFGNV